MPNSFARYHVFPGARLATRVAVTALLMTGLAPPLTAQQSSPQPQSFRRSIRPILSTYCFSCHGPDEEHREADLRLDTPAGVSAVLTAGNSDESELIRRILSDDPDEVMPPPASKKELSRAQKERLRQWIDDGAQWDKHWAYEPLSRPAPPGPLGRQSALRQNPIDSFIQAKLVELGLEPSAPAPRQVMIRRLTLDLTGLPPTPAEVDAFVADNSLDAYERLVDRLMESPAFGERMAWNWLDAARYSDTNGYQGDRERTMWPWRDWVITSLNHNLSYRDFTVWQIAGDLLPNATFEQQLATGFCRNHMINGEGGRIPEENRIEYVMDMTETIGTVWLGLTLNCCRCHDHKFDPITQREYYSLFAFFNQTPVNGGGGDPQTPPVLAAPSREQERRMTRLQSQLADAINQLESRRKLLAAGQDKWEAKQAESESHSAWRIAKPVSARADHQMMKLLEDGSILAGGELANNDNYEVAVELPIGKIAAIRLEALRHSSLVKNSLSRADSGNFVLTGLEFALRSQDGELRALAVASAKATFEQGTHKVQTALDGKSNIGWAVYEGRVVDREHAAIFRLRNVVECVAGDQLVVRLRHESPHVRHNLGRFRLATSSKADATFALESAWLADLQTPRAQRSKEQQKRIASAYLATDGKLGQQTAKRDNLKKQVDSLKSSLAKVMVMADQPERRKSFRLTRGLYNKPADEVDAGTPASLPPLPGARRDRLALAEWVVSEENPLAARVTVNRVWQQFFGVGLVKTTEDFGVQGETPEHQDLLDWLASTFREHEWDLKRLVRMIVTSHAYRQSSKSTPALLAADRENRFLARAPRYRLPSWMIRDQALAASGLLVREVGGPSVNGYQPPGIWEEATFGKKKYQQGKGKSLYRRSLYTFWRRIIAPTMFFDNASRQVCTVKLFRTNTPLHALATLNDQTFVEAARALSAHALHDASLASDADRVGFVFRRVLARAPTDSEMGILLAALDRTRLQFRESPQAAADFLAIGESPVDSQLDSIEHATWASLCLAVFNLDEALSKQ